MLKRTSVKILLFAVLIGCLAIVAKPTAPTPQQSFSGGQAVTVTNIPHVIVDTAPSTAVTGTFWQATQPVSLSTLPALVAGTAKFGIPYPYTSCGTTAFTIALQAMPTSSTAITSTTTCLLNSDISNTSGGSLTVTVSDNQGTPINWLNGVTMLAGEHRLANWPNGKKFTSGIKVIASGAGITYTMEGLQ